MQRFKCFHCGHKLYFDNIQCLGCGYTVAFVPAKMQVAAIEPIGTEQNLWSLADDTFVPNARYKLCRNSINHNICNWVLDEADTHTLCASCRMTTLIPSLHDPQHRECLYKMERAKRRLIINLKQLGLPVLPGETRFSLRFAFPASLPGQPRVMTGHKAGLVTVNLDEADDVARTRARKHLEEPYRTVLGHLRHEVGHFYWDELIAANQTELQNFRNRFGDDRQDYAQALENHYNAPNMNWKAAFISSYASSHPWEDWAETWAHYLHLRALVITSADFDCLTDDAQLFIPSESFDDFFAHCMALTESVNELNRSLGQDDAYPFSVCGAVKEKLAYVHDVVARHALYTQPMNAMMSQSQSTVSLQASAYDGNTF